jgi:hypothetical protein
MRKTFSYIKKHFVIVTCISVLLAVGVIWAVVANVAHDTQVVLGTTFTFDPVLHSELKGREVEWSIEITRVTKDGIPVSENEYQNYLKKSGDAKKSTVSRNLNKKTKVDKGFNYNVNFPDEGTWVIEYNIIGVVVGVREMFRPGSVTFEATSWPTQSGVCVPPGWTNSNGSITTPPPPATEPGPSIVSDEKYPYGFDMSFDFTFPVPPPNGVVEPVIPEGKTEKPSFYPNSGVYIYGVTEIQIIDTNALIAAGYTSNGDGKIYKNNANVGELTTECLSGESYWNNPSKPYDIGYAVAEHPNLVSNLNPAGTANNMEISVRPNPSEPGEKTLTVKVNGVETYTGVLPAGTGTMNGVTPNEYVYTQSHWGSSVTFSDISIKAPETKP